LTGRCCLLRSGDRSRPLFVPKDAESQQTFADVQAGWLACVAPGPACRRRRRRCGRAAGRSLCGRIDAFVSAIESQLARWTTVLNAFQFVMMALAIAAGGGAAVCRLPVCLQPAVAPAAGLARVGEGDLAARVEVDSSDEFGELSAGFNRMAQTLQGLYQNLEARVAEKTLGLETERARLAALYEAAAFVASATSLDALAQGFAQQVRRVARADASAVRWSDESNQRYLLLASDCLPQQLVDAEQCVPTGGCFCGQRQRRRRRRASSPSAPCPAKKHAGHCERAGFETVISVPVRLHERMVGEINLFYRTAATLSDEDRTLLETLASHLAGAIESLRAGALEREAAVAEERGLLARELHDSIAQSLSFLKIQAGLLRDALRRHDAAKAEPHAGRTGRRRARKPGRRARTAAALPHPHQQRGHRTGAAHHADRSSNTRPAWPRTCWSKATACR
jgi:two-component system nitrate/nitrite sensor histidine kinase NarX